MKHYPGLNQLRTQGQSCQTTDDCQIRTFNFLGIHIFHRELYSQGRPWKEPGQLAKTTTTKTHYETKWDINKKAEF